jgi:hypothetical protein
MAQVDENTIEVKVDQVAQLFDTLDPYPFPERDLNRDAEEYIVGWAQELASQESIRIVIHFPDTPHQKDAFPALREAIAKYFASRSQSIQRDLNELFRIGRLSLLVGVGILIACLFLAHLTARYSHQAPLNRLIEESFLILGWVANWRPLEIFLYDWWPLKRKRDLFRRLAQAKVEERPFNPDQ